MNKIEIRWKNFGIRPTVFLDTHTDFKCYDVVKYTTDNSGKENCYSIASLRYNPKEPHWEFDGLSVRYLRERTDGLDELILNTIEVLNTMVKYED